MSVVICAYTEDRWDDLVDAVASSLAQTHRPAEVVVVIDHNDAMLLRARMTLSGAIVLGNAGRERNPLALDSDVQRPGRSRVGRRVQVETLPDAAGRGGIWLRAV